MQRGYADTTLGQMHFREEGEGPALILLHPAAQSSRMFTDLMPMLSHWRRVVAIDAPGHGDSDRPLKPPTVAEQMRTVLEVMNYLGIPQADILGQGIGAVVALALAQAHPTSVGALILSSLPDDRVGARATLLKRSGPRSCNYNGDHLAAAWSFVEAQAHAASTLQMHRAAIDVLKAEDCGDFADQAALEVDIASSLAASATSVLLLIGELDGLADRSLVLAQDQEIEIIVIANTGPMVVVEAPNAVAQALTAFLHQHVAPTEAGRARSAFDPPSRG